MDTIREYTIGEFRGSFPDVPIASGVDLEEIKQIDASPIFVTLPVIPRIGNVSKNGLLYDEALASSIEEQINTKRPGGIFGHLKEEDRNTAFPMPSGMWVGAKREGDTLWAKAWISGAAKDYIRQLKAVGGQIATSIYGKGSYEKVKDGVQRLTNFTLESLDFAPPERAALGYGAMPIVTAELEQPTTGEDSTMDKTQLLAELTVNDVPATIKEQIVTEYKKANDQSAKVAELEKALAGKDTQLAALETSVAEFKRREFENTVAAKVAELTKWTVKGEQAEKRLTDFRKLLRKQIEITVGDEREPEKVAELIGEAWESVKSVAETLRDALAGPRAIVPQKERGPEPRTVDTSPEALAKISQKFGFTF